MKLFGRYVKARIKILITYVFMAGIFASSYLLFDMPAISVLYPLSMALAVGIIIMIIDFIMFRSRHEKLVLEELPAPKDQIEEDYQLIINKLQEESKMAQLKASEDYNNMIEYYMMLSTEENKQKLELLISAFFNRLHGYHVQYNIVSRDTLIDAQLHPENHKDLIVRVAGYSAFFNVLSKKTQDDIIERTEQTL